MTEEYKFQKLRVYQLALDYIDAIYGISAQLPQQEMYNLRSQIIRAATSIALNIAEGSTGQSDAEQGRFIGHALRSYLETIACLDICGRRGYFSADEIKPFRNQGHDLFIKLQAFRRSLQP
jgi:four helix bundle protein